MNNTQHSQQDSSANKSEIQPSIIGTIGLVILLEACAGLLMLVLAIPLFINGMLSIDTIQLPHYEFLEKVGIFGVSILTLAELIAIFICLHFLLKRDGIKFKSLGFQFNGYKKDALIGAAIGIAIMASCFLLLFSTDYITYTTQDFTQVPWLSSITLFLFVAVHEEVLCRGFIQGRLMGITSPYKALFISSIIFMAMHLGNDNWTFISLLNLALAGVTFGLYYLHTKNLWFPIALHFTWNFFQGPVFGFEVSGGKMESWLTITRANNPLITGGEFGLEGSILVTAFEVLTIILIHLNFTMNKAKPEIVTEASIAEDVQFNDQQSVLEKSSAL